MAENDQLQSLLKNLQEAFKSYTVQEINAAILDFLNKKGDKNEEISFVLNNIAGEYGITKRTLLNSGCRGKISQAKNIAYCVLHYNLGLPIRHISVRVFSRSEGNHLSVFKATKYFRSLNTDVKVDREFKDIYERIVKKLNEFIKTKTEDGK